MAFKSSSLNRPRSVNHSCFKSLMLRIVLWTDLYSSSGFACSLYKKAVLKGKPKEVKYVVAKKSQGTFYPVLFLNFLWPLTSRDRERIALSFFPCNRVQGSLLLLCQTQQNGINAKLLSVANACG